MENNDLNYLSSAYTDETKPEEVINEGDPEGYSEDVLIDLDGFRKTFSVGWYDFDDDVWKLNDESMEIHIDRKNMKWFKLPLDRGK